MDDVTRNKIVFVDNGNTQDNAETKKGKSKIDPLLSEWIGIALMGVVFMEVLLYLLHRTSLL